ncbi:MAG: glycosyltransferase family 2 protein [Rhodoferax sp.]|nr:glycosyltransferase family 2 protein [Rhodoferax sp.]
MKQEPKLNLSNPPILSVVVPVHNGALWLGETLSSILEQSFKDFEIILVDDASTDNLQSVINSYTDPRLTVIHLEKNVGVAEARNQGIRRSVGEYIAFCDSDDICLPMRFAAQIAFMQQQTEIGVCGSAFTCFDTLDRETVLNPCTDAEIRSLLMIGNCFGMSTIMGRAEIFQQHRFDQALRASEDYDLWTRLAAAGVALANLPETLLRYRLHAQQASRNKSEMLDQLARKIRAIYCGRLLGKADLLEQMYVETITLTDLSKAANAIVEYCNTHTDVSKYQFRFLLAWLYQKLPQHGIREWKHWSEIQELLHLRLDRNYRFNIALLAFLPFAIGMKYFDTLIKLKR